MKLSRRQTLALGGSFALALGVRAQGAAPVVIEMAGTARGEHVWFTPHGLAIEPGSTVRFVNNDPVNAHTATAYHPDLSGRPRRIPRGAEAWDSGFLMPGDTFEVRLTMPGVYDYYCRPHEYAGMAGRILVGTPSHPFGRSPPWSIREFPRPFCKPCPPWRRSWLQGPSCTQTGHERAACPLPGTCTAPCGTGRSQPGRRRARGRGDCGA